MKCKIDQIAFEIDVFHSGLRGLFPFGHATSDRLFLSFSSASGRLVLGPCSEMFLLVSTR